MIKIIWLAAGWTAVLTAAARAGPEKVKLTRRQLSMAPSIV